MSSAGLPIYCIDTNSLMDWQVRFYPTDVFASLLERFYALIKQERLVAPELVREEIGIVGSPELIAWANDRDAMFKPNAAVIAEAQSIQHRFPGLLDPKSLYEEADAYIIAMAKANPAGIVVTQETPASEKPKPKRSHFIPDVCRELGINCFNLMGMMRREGWRL